MIEQFQISRLARDVGHTINHAQPRGIGLRCKSRIEPQAIAEDPGLVDDSSHAIVATIMVTRGPDRLTQQATADSAGNFRVRFEVGTGDYLVYVSAPGFSSSRIAPTRKP